MNWLLIFKIVYWAIAMLVCMRIVYDTRSTAKALGYILLIALVPIAGIIIYFSLGVNHRKNKIYSKKLTRDENLVKKTQEEILEASKQSFQQGGAAVQNSEQLAFMLVQDKKSLLSKNNAVKLLVNGEQKFPEVIKALQEAKDHIHIEYYIYEEDEIGKTIEKVLIEKAKEGVVVRFIYDDFGSRSIRKTLVPRLKAAGVKAFPFYKVLFLAFANRLNYRNHRKIIVVDGRTAFLGGINVSDRYINKSKSKKLFWRDTHLRIDGPGVQYLQYLFLCDWNFCANDQLKPTKRWFPPPESLPTLGNKNVQIAASGPDSDTPTILFSMLRAIYMAKKEILITTPYFIPGESILNAIMIASLGGVKVKLLVPGISDSVLVNTAARSYYGELLDAGVEIYLYKKGFIHAKTMVVDSDIAMVGSANMDYRSFDLNFEVNALVYDEEISVELAGSFYEDLKFSEKIDPKKWKERKRYIQLIEKTARLISPLL